MKCRHFIFLLVLLSLVLFLSGFRLGKKIERLDKTYIPPLSPTTTPKPTPTQRPLQFNTFLSADCGLKFLYPSFFSEEESATNEGRLTFQDEQISLTCQKEKIEEFNKNKKSLAQEEEATIANQKIIIYQAPQKNHLLFSLFNAKNGKMILFTIPKNLFNLFAETLEFL